MLNERTICQDNGQSCVPATRWHSVVLQLFGSLADREGTRDGGGGISIQGIGPTRAFTPESKQAPLLNITVGVISPHWLMTRPSFPQWLTSLCWDDSLEGHHTLCTGKAGARPGTIPNIQQTPETVPLASGLAPPQKQFGHCLSICSCCYFAKCHS